MADIDHEKIDRLATKAKTGDKEAFSEIVRMLTNDLVAMTSRMTGSVDSAKDLTQDTFIAAWQSLSGFRSESRFASWLYRIAVNKTLNFLRRQANSPVITGQVADNFELEKGAYGARSDREIEQKQLKAEVLEFMQSLPPRQRLAFELRFYKQLPFESIAEITESALGTVKTNYRQAIIKLREYALSRGWQE